MKFLFGGDYIGMFIIINVIFWMVLVVVVVIVMMVFGILSCKIVSGCS